MENLKQSPQWVNWILFANPNEPDKPSKIPKNPKNGYPASVENSATWNSFEMAQSKVGKNTTHRIYIRDEKGNRIKDEKGKDKYQDVKCEIAGVGFTFANGICGIDLDNKKGDPQYEERANDIRQLMNTYTEYSPSGAGEHLIFKCDMSRIPTVEETIKDKKTGEAIIVRKLDPAYYQKNPHNDVECYFSGLTNRFFTYTGEAINSLGIEDRTEQVLQFLDKYMRKNPPRSASPAEEKTKINVHMNKLDIISIARKAKNSNKFIKLFDNGDISDYNNDDSSADLALCNMLAFYAQGDFNEIDRLFRQSALYRQKWERSDYRTATINKAVSLCGGEFYRPKGRPKKETDDEDDKPKYLTVDGLQAFMQDNDISVTYNVITRFAAIKGLEQKYSSEHLQGTLPLILTELINNSQLYKKRTNKDTVQDFLSITLSQHSHQYNPVLEMLNNNKWDGQDRIKEIFGILHIDNADRLSQTLLYKWFWQGLSMARNELKDAYGADGLLVLQGGQGIGKTTLVRKLAVRQEFCGIGKSLNFQDKDTLRRCSSNWLVELGEIETTFRSDKEKLKSFITDEIDEYRLPYGRTDVKLARRTSLIGTCNSTEYLIDETGNRRFWTVPLINIDLNALRNFNALQLWLQIDSLTNHNRQGFRLTKEEQAQLAERNGRHEKPLKGELEVRDIISTLSNDSRYFEKEVTITDFKATHRALDKYSSEQIGKVLDKMGIESKRTKQGRFRKLPMIGEDFK